MKVTYSLVASKVKKFQLCTLKSMALLILFFFMTSAQAVNLDFQINYSNPNDLLFNTLMPVIGVVFFVIAVLISMGIVCNIVTCSKIIKIKKVFNFFSF
jgi:hypothetical protein